MTWAGDAPRGWKLWLVFFVYAAAAAAAVQLALRYLLPQLHAGDGLLAGLDATTFHRIAVARAAEIDAVGWSAWALRPEDGGYIAGVASAFYALVVPQPWVLIPLNAAVHAGAAFLLFRTVLHVTGAAWPAIAAAAPFLLYPSALSWYSQLSDDGWFVLGTLLFLNGWVGLAAADESVLGRLRVWSSAAAVVAGVFLAWLARPYMSFLMEAFGVAAALLLTVVFCVRAFKAQTSPRRAAAAVVMCWLIVAAGVQVTSTGVASAWLPEAAGEPPPSIVELGQVPASGDPDVDVSRALLLQETGAAAAWRDVSWLPPQINRRLYGLADWRDRFRRSSVSPDSTDLDSEVGFRGGMDVIAYVPRAAAIGLFAPFPEQWFTQGRQSGGTLMRRITAIEMIGLYLGLACVPYAVWRWRRRVSTYLLLAFCAGSITVFSLVVTNVGALYRFRYPFVMTLAGFGLAGLLAAVAQRRASSDRQLSGTRIHVS